MTLREVWRGQARLWVTYWLFGVGGNMGFLALLLAIAWVGRPDPPLGWLWTVYLMSLAWFVFVFGAIWRAAGRYRGPRVWAALARLGVLVGIVRMGIEAALLLDATIRS